MLAAPVVMPLPGRAGGSGFHLPAPGTLQNVPGFVPGLAVPGLARVGAPGGT